MRGSAPREAFAGVRTSAPDEADRSDLSCCAYGRACRLFDDSDLAATLDAEQHLQPWLDNESVMVDRYDVRLLLHDTAQIHKSLHRRSNPSQIDSSNGEAELDFERYRDLQPELEDPQTLPESEASLTEAAQAEVQSDSTAYAAIPYVYDTPEAEAAQPVAPSELVSVLANAVPHVAFVPSFAVPVSVQDHLPNTERMHKIILQTAKFVQQAGGQTEFVLRVKQAANPNFNFLEPNDRQHPYFRWLVATKPEDILNIDAAPSAVVDSTALELPSVASGNQDKSTPTVSMSAVQQPSPQEESPESIPIAQVSAAQPQVSVALGSTSTSTEHNVSGTPALPVADMQALAKRIGMAQPAPPQPSKHGFDFMQVPDLGIGGRPPQAVRPSRPASAPAVNAPGVVPSEIQAIIQKLVHFIKKAGPRFEATVRNKEKANPRFAFLLPWNQYHTYYRQQLVEVLGQAMADEVIALRAGSVPKALQAQPMAGIATGPAIPQQQSSPVMANNASDAHASQAAAEVLHLQADAVIPAGSQLANSLALNSSYDGKASQEEGAASATGSAATDSDVKLQADQQDSAASSIAEGAEAQVSPEAAGGGDKDAAGRTPPPGVIVLCSNPRFAIKPVKPAMDAADLVVNGHEGGSEDSDEKPRVASPGPTSQAVKGRKDRQEPDAQLPTKQQPKAQSTLQQEVEGEVVRQDLDSVKQDGQPAREEQHDAHAAAFSLEAVMEAQSALIHERQQKAQPDMTEDERKAQRRRLVRQMLETKQKSQADAEEEKRKMQQSALAKYRQAFTSDTEEEVIHMKLEDDEAYEAPEPGEIVDEPVGKPVSGPVLSAPPPSPLPSLEALIKPRQDLVPQQRIFPLPSSSAQQSSQAGERGAEAGTGSMYHSSDSDASRTHRRHRHRHKRSRSSSDDSRSQSKKSTHKSKHRRRSRSRSEDSRSHIKRRRHKRRPRHSSRSRRSTERRQASKRNRRRSSQSSRSDSSHSESGSHGRRKRSKDDAGSSADSEEGAQDDAEALRAKIRAVLGGL